MHVRAWGVVVVSMVVCACVCVCVCVRDRERERESFVHNKSCEFLYAVTLVFYLLYGPLDLYDLFALLDVSLDTQ